MLHTSPQYPLLQQSKRPNTWRDWFASAGVDDVNAWAGPRFEHFYMVIQAALAGLGIAVVPRILIIEELRAGRLVEPSTHPALTTEAYYLVHPEKKRASQKLSPSRIGFCANSLIAISTTSRPAFRLSSFGLRL